MSHDIRETPTREFNFGKMYDDGHWRASGSQAGTIGRAPNKE